MAVQTKKTISVICKQCAEKFLVTPYVARNRNPQYCGKECSRKAKYKRKTFNCKNCGEKVERIASTVSKGNNYCSKKCSRAQNNNRLHLGLPKHNQICLFCESTFLTRKCIFCSVKCSQQYRRKKNIENWLKTGLTGYKLGINKGLPSRVRSYVLQEANNNCEICGWNKKNSFTGRIPLEIHHKDHNPFNDSKENLQVLCPNCHSLTKGHKGFNRGNRRTLRLDGSAATAPPL